MKTRVHPNQAPRGFTLIECLVYISVLGVILAIGSAAFYRCWDDNKAITRNSNEIVQTLKVGEAWRADMRAATGPIHITTNNSEQTIRIPHGKTEVIYSFANGEILKQTGANGPRQLLLGKIKASQMEIDKREQVTACRWELELRSQRKNAKVRPLFTFLVVPGNTVVE
ncbi:MAG TPA: prepilin-type N-terminal cleavage/methylation domain-containing protein [Candidatus Angelobacter sp.]|nr:prepilin-type N-terminal cleavage/methylation domain-containing protein [Candidatus Angelobacter sp.]